jgi:hypothetical protein
MRLNESQHLLDLGCRRVVLDHFSLRIDEKLSEVPGNHSGSSGLGVIELTVASEVGVDRMSLLSVDLHLLHQRELGVEPLACEFLNLLRGSAFLSKELVAGESQDFKAVVFPTLISLGHFRVVVSSKPTLRSNIDHHDELLSPESLEVKRVTLDVIHLEVEERLHVENFEFLSS